MNIFLLLVKDRLYYWMLSYFNFYCKRCGIPCSARLYCTVCPTRYQTRHLFNISNTNEDVATKFEEEYVRCVRNEEECVCSSPNCCDTVKLLKNCRVR